MGKAHTNTYSYESRLKFCVLLIILYVCGFNFPKHFLHFLRERLSCLDEIVAQVECNIPDSGEFVFNIFDLFHTVVEFEICDLKSLVHVMDTLLSFGSLKAS